MHGIGLQVPANAAIWRIFMSPPFQKLWAPASTRPNSFIAGFLSPTLPALLQHVFVLDGFSTSGQFRLPWTSVSPPPHTPQTHTQQARFSLSRTDPTDNGFRLRSCDLLIADWSQICDILSLHGVADTGIGSGRESGEGREGREGGGEGGGRKGGGRGEERTDFLSAVESQ